MVGAPLKKEKIPTRCLGRKGDVLLSRAARLGQLTHLYPGSSRSPVWPIRGALGGAEKRDGLEEGEPFLWESLQALQEMHQLPKTPTLRITALCCHHGTSMMKQAPFRNEATLLEKLLRKELSQGVSGECLPRCDGLFLLFGSTVVVIMLLVYYSLDDF